MLISLPNILIKYNISPKGIIHIGAHMGEEVELYHAQGIRKVLWIEGNPNVIDILKENTATFEGNHVLQAVVSDVDGQKLSLKITNASMSSSVLNLKSHLHSYPDIFVENEINVTTQRIDSIFEQHSFNIHNYDFVNLDIQGSELFALKGMGNILQNIKYIYSEVNVRELYEGCPMLDELDDFLLEQGFFRVELALTDEGWGDAFYMKQTLNFTEVAQQKLATQKLMVSSQIKNEFSWNNFKHLIVNTLKKAPFIFEIIKKILGVFVAAKRSVEGIPTDLSAEEVHLLRTLLKDKAGKTVVIFDVGSNRGDFSDFCIRICKKYNIKYTLHLFEPQPENVAILKTKYSTNHQVIVNGYALSDSTKEVSFFRNAVGSSLGSLYNRDIFQEPEKIVVQCSTLAQYVEINQIETIDLLKIDTEGHELFVLKGGAMCFDKIKNIQFEYGGSYLDANTTLKEVYSLLKQQYRIGKLTVSEPHFLPYLPHLEDFQYANFLAQKR